MGLFEFFKKNNVGGGGFNLKGALKKPKMLKQAALFYQRRESNKKGAGFPVNVTKTTAPYILH